jgi:hypothetical protein
MLIHSAAAMRVSLLKSIAPASKYELDILAAPTVAKSVPSVGKALAN